MAICVRVRLSLQLSPDGLVAVDDGVEQRLDAGRGKHRFRIAARGHERRLEAMRLDHVDEPHRVVEHFDAAVAQAPVECLVLAVAEPADRVPLGRVVRIAIWQVEFARFKKRADALVARPAVDEAVIVVVREGRSLAARRQKRVEHVRPGNAVERGGVGDDAVEVEHAGIEAGQVEGYRAIGHVPQCSGSGLKPRTGPSCRNAPRCGGRMAGSAR
jgi:hypothetical protein